MAVARLNHSTVATLAVLASADCAAGLSPAGGEAGIDWRALGRAAGRASVGAGGVAAGAAPVSGARIKSAAFRLTLETRLPAGPIEGAWALPTEIRMASGLPVVITGAAALAGTSKLSPAANSPCFRTLPPSLIATQTDSVAVMTTAPAGAGDGVAGTATLAGGGGVLDCLRNRLIGFHRSIAEPT